MRGPNRGLLDICAAVLCGEEGAAVPMPAARKGNVGGGTDALLTSKQLASDRRDRNVMAEHENPLPEGGDIVAEIQSGRLTRRNFVMSIGVAGAAVFGSGLFSGVESLNALTATSTKTPIFMAAKGVLLH